MNEDNTQPVQPEDPSAPEPEQLIPNHSRRQRPRVWLTAFGVVLLVAILLLASHNAKKPPVTPPTTKTPPSKQADDLLFDSDRTGNYEIYRANPDGSVKQLTTDKVYDSFWPKPSPDGTKLVFQRSPKGSHDRDYTKTSLWGANIDGSNLHELIPNKGYGWVVQGHAEWAPDGTSLVIIGGLGNLYIVKADGSSPVEVRVTGQTSKLTDPSWSPDGEKVAYTYNGDVWVVSKNGGTPTRLTNDKYTDYDPYFSPDGASIAFLTNVSGGTWSIRQMKSDGSGLKFFINDGKINSKPNWSPDGSRIYFHRHPSGAGKGYFGLWVQNSDGSSLTPIDVGNGANEYPAVIKQ